MDSKLIGNEILIRHLEGTSTHQLADQFGCSQSKIYRELVKSIKSVPNSNHVTEVACDKFSGFLEIDGKYFKVKGVNYVLIWAVDYYTHDIVWYEITNSENLIVVSHMLKRIRSSNYNLKFLICDDNISFQTALRLVFPKAKLQICIVHYQRSIQRLLDKKDDRDNLFINDIKNLFKTRSNKKFSNQVRTLFYKYPEKKYSLILMEMGRKSNLLTYLDYAKCPSTTNLIEGYNKHLDVRLRKIDGFKSIENAQLWLNAYIWYKRTKKLRHCKGRFRNLNGFMPLALTAKDSLENIYLLKSLKN